MNFSFSRFVSAKTYVTQETYFICCPSLARPLYGISFTSLLGFRRGKKLSGEIPGRTRMPFGRVPRSGESAMLESFFSLMPLTVFLLKLSRMTRDGNFGFWTEGSSHPTAGFLRNYSTTTFVNCCWFVHAFFAFWWMFALGELWTCDWKTSVKLVPTLDVANSD